jgi:hypothetical protein
VIFGTKTNHLATLITLLLSFNQLSGQSDWAQSVPPVWSFVAEAVLPLARRSVQKSKTIWDRCYDFVNIFAEKSVEKSKIIWDRCYDFVNIFAEIFVEKK